MDVKCENAAMHDGQLAALVQAFKAGHSTAESEVIVDGPHVLARNADIRPVMIVGVVAIRNHRIQSIVAARKFQDDKDLSVGLGLIGQRGGRLRKQRHGKSGGAHSDAIHAEAQQIAAVGSRKRKMILLHGSSSYPS
jgi:hypothetical protein